ncbi:MAG: TauD/TfdA family dioxygenase [Ramlibacter sp.]|nr:TauD/TfdA family dioxygenase [Ramlibacter sp.]
MEISVQHPARRLGAGSAFQSDVAALVGDIRAQLLSGGIANIAGFPLSKEQYFQLAALFGRPMRKHTAEDGGGTDEYIGVVRYEPPAEGDKQPPTKGASALPFHTARAYVRVRPSHFFMLMVNGGAPGPAGCRGESQLVRWDNLLQEFRQLHPEHAEADIKLLSTFPVSYKPDYVKEEASVDPLISSSPSGEITVRYWEYAFAKLAGSTDIQQRKGGPQFLDALSRFDSVLTAPFCRYETVLTAGQLVVIDNRRIAHGRRGFSPIVSDASGRPTPNPREMWTMHVEERPHVENVA